MRATGKPTLAKVVEGYSSITKDPNYDPAYSGIADWRDVNSNLSAKEVDALADWVIKNRVASGRWAILVAEPLVTAYAMLYAKKVNTVFPNQIYSEVHSASLFLGMDLQPFLDAF